MQIFGRAYEVTDDREGRGLGRAVVFLSRGLLSGYARREWGQRCRQKGIRKGNVKKVLPLFEKLFF